MSIELRQITHVIDAQYAAEQAWQNATTATTASKRRM